MIEVINFYLWNTFLWDKIMIEFLVENKLFLLFIVIAVGYLAGKIKIKGFSLGISAVLFSGLAFGSLNKDLVLPDIVYVIGLVIFVYTIGLQSGANFFESFKKNGLRDNIFIVLMVISAAALTCLLAVMFTVDGPVAAGLFCGTFTNTPALAAVIEALKQANAELIPADLNQLLATPVVGYSLAYPVGVIGMIICFQATYRFWKINPDLERAELSKSFGLGGQEVVHANVAVQNPNVVGKTIRQVFNGNELKGVVISRIHQNGDLSIVKPETVLNYNDVITVVAQHDLLDKVIPVFGIISSDNLSSSRVKIDMRRIFVSNQDVIGRKIKTLDLQNLYGATITRVRRGDADFVPSSETILEAGDRIRVVALQEDMKKVTSLFGDSYHRLSEVDYISMAVGIAIGLLLGSIEIPLPGGNQFHLGFAGGPLIVALILGRLRRTKGLIWVMSYNTNLTLRQMGAVLFLAGIGLKSGFTFASTFQNNGIQLVALSFIIILFTGFVTLWVGKTFLKIPYSILLGMLSGLQTQPATLAYANETMNNGGPNLGYSVIYPTAMITKIILGQVILFVLLR